MKYDICHEKALFIHKTNICAFCINDVYLKIHHLNCKMFHKYMKNKQKVARNMLINRFVTLNIRRRHKITLLTDIIIHTWYVSANFKMIYKYKLSLYFHAKKTSSNIIICIVAQFLTKYDSCENMVVISLSVFISLASSALKLGKFRTTSIRATSYCQASDSHIGCNNGGMHYTR